MSDGAAWLDALAAALKAEREALIARDAAALIDANRAKVEALAAREADPPVEARERIAELAELNRANGALLARRQREVRWALRHLGRVEAETGYDVRGRMAVQPRSRVLGYG